MSMIGLMADARETCTMLDRRTVADGQGGYIQTWVDGAEFQASIVKDSSMQARVAEKQGVTEVYTVYVDSNVELDYHDVFRRESDGSVFRVTSNIQDKKTPARATFQVGFVNAEKWVLPT